MPTLAEKTTFPSILLHIGSMLPIFWQTINGPNPSQLDIKLFLPVLTNYINKNNTSKVFQNKKLRKQCTDYFGWKENSNRPLWVFHVQSRGESMCWLNQLRGENQRETLWKLGRFLVLFHFSQSVQEWFLIRLSRCYERCCYEAKMSEYGNVP